MVFKRRNPRTYFRAFIEAFYPKGGWTRAARYVIHRVRRLPDPSHKISRGIAVGVFVSFTPLFGFHFVVAMALAWVIRGNMLAALLATFFGNPLTFPLIAATSMTLGSFILGLPDVPLHTVFADFGYAAGELWRNFMAALTGGSLNWGRLGQFFSHVFLPYLVGGLLPGLILGIAFYFLSNPVIAAYQKARVARLKRRFAKKREKAISRRLEMAEAGGVGGDRTAAE